MTIEEYAANYGGLLMACFAAGFGVGFLINMTRRYFEKL